MYTTDNDFEVIYFSYMALDRITRGGYFVLTIRKFGFAPLDKWNITSLRHVVSFTNYKVKLHRSLEKIRKTKQGSWITISYSLPTVMYIRMLN